MIEFHVCNIYFTIHHSTLYTVVISKNSVHIVIAHFVLRAAVISPLIYSPATLLGTPRVRVMWHQQSA